ncbi:MAG: class I SAM-dependent rRNA methyltransferase [Bryobacteraceae bacterium]
MSNVPVVRVNRKAADRIFSGHPWIFASDVIDRGSARSGDAVTVTDARGKALGTAHYSSSSQITLRFLSRRVELIDTAFLQRSIEAAHRFRQRIVQNSNAYRLVHAEGDLLPGLIVDRYADCISLQLLDQGMDRLSTEIIEVLRQLLQPNGIIARNDVATRAKENLDQEVKILSGTVPERVTIEMNGLRFQVDLLTGQKTGVFLDQRENYLAVRRWGRGRALDCFTGSGGFALHLASVCDSVEAVDSSGLAIGTAKGNADMNGITNIEFRESNVLDYLPPLVSAKRTFDVVIVDPPAFTKSRSALEGAVRGYKEINLRALRLLRTGGILVSCSCSHHMTEAHLFEVIAEAALDGNKQLRVLERRTQANDHPILLTVPETHYLKCLVFEVI